jgi:hypothetical protein
MHKLILLAALLAPFSARADILFLDMNDSPKEIEAAAKAARARGERLIVYPQMSEENRAENERIKAQLKRTTREFERVCNREADRNACTAVDRQMRQLYDAQRKITQNIRFDMNKLKDVLEKHNKNGGKVNSLVISGHDGTGHFNGVFGDMSDRGLSEMLDSIPGLKDNLLGIHLWGCYTTSPSSILTNWKANFPNTVLVTGYNGVAPANDKPAGWNYLEAVLKQELDLIAETDQKKLQRMLKNMPGVNFMPAAAFNRGDCFISPSDTFSFTELMSRCKDLMAKLKTQQDQYNCYLKAENEQCANPPSDTRNGVIRQFYNLVQNAGPCGELEEYRGQLRISRDQVIRMVFFPEVKKNYAGIYGKEIGEVDESLEALGAPPTLRFKDMEKLSRRDLLLRIDELNKFLQKEYQKLGVNMDEEAGMKDAQLLMLRNFQRSLTSTLSSLSPDCVPFNWVEPAAREESQCTRREDLGRVGVERALAHKSDLKRLRLDMQRRFIDEKRYAIQQKAADEGRRMNARERAEVNLLGLEINAIYMREYPQNDPRRETHRLNLERAKKMMELAEAGDENPENHPTVVLYKLRSTVASFKSAPERDKRDLAEYERMLATTTNPDDRKHYEINIAAIKLRLVRSDKRIELSELHLKTIELEAKEIEAKKLNGELSQEEKAELERARAAREVKGLEYGKLVIDEYLAHYNRELQMHEEAIRVNTERGQTEEVNYLRQRVQQIRQEMERQSNNMESMRRKHYEDFLHSLNRGSIY